MDPDLAKRVNPVIAPSPFVLQSSALHATDDTEDVRICHFTVFALVSGEIKFSNRQISITVYFQFSLIGLFSELILVVPTSWVSERQFL